METNIMIKKARDFCRQKHHGQIDDTGLAYSLHPYFVAELIETIAPQDINLICAAYLHDTIEDTDTTHDELMQKFNEDVADLVNEVSHEGKKDEYGFYFPRLKTQRGIILKFADRMHNLSRMEAWDIGRQEHYLKKSKFWKSKGKLKCENCGKEGAHVEQGAFRKQIVCNFNCGYQLDSKESLARVKNETFLK